jgi:hypothetical protein
MEEGRKAKARLVVSTIFDRFARDKVDGVAYYPNPNENPETAKLVALLEGCRSRALAKIQALCPRAVTYRLEVGWILDNRFNAVAGIQDDVDCIAINLGVVLLMNPLIFAGTHICQNS